MANGYTLSRVPGRGLSNIWTITKNGETKRACVRTTRDRWIAFPPLEQGAKWKTLDEVQLVIVAAVDSKEKPKNIEVYLLPADEVRRRFNAAYAARVGADHVVRENYGMWVGLDPDPRENTPGYVGSGIIAQYPRVAVYSVESLLADEAAEPASDAEEIEVFDGVQERAEEPGEPERALTIAGVMARAREQLAEIAGVRVEAVKLDLKIEY